MQHQGWSLRRTKPGTSHVIVLLVSLLASGMFQSGTADDIPLTMTYQGYLLNDAGIPQGGVHNMTFGIYTAPENGTLLWEEDHNNATSQVEVDQFGLFEVLLGEFVPLSPTVFPADGSTPYLQVEVDGEVLQPRKPLNSVPYAFVATTDAVEGNTLDEAYDQGGPGAGRTIVADAGAVNITGTDGLAVQADIVVDDDVDVGDLLTADRITAESRFIFPFDYDSGWERIYPGSSNILTLYHNLGGDYKNYIVHMDGSSSSLGTYPHQCNYGSNLVHTVGEHWIGCEWYHLTSSQIRVVRGDFDNDPSVTEEKQWDYVRIRILKNQ